MKKIFLSLALVGILVCLASAADFVHYSTKTSSALVTTGSGYYHGLKLNSDGTNAVTVVVYDNTTATGTAIDPSTVYPTSSTQRAASSSFSPPRRYYNGLYVSITCAGTASVTIDFVPD